MPGEQLRALLQLHQPDGPTNATVTQLRAELKNRCGKFAKGRKNLVEKLLAWPLQYGSGSIEKPYTPVQCHKDEVAAKQQAFDAMRDEWEVELVQERALEALRLAVSSTEKKKQKSNRGAVWVWVLRRQRQHGRWRAVGTAHGACCTCADSGFSCCNAPSDSSFLRILNCLCESFESS